MGEGGRVLHLGKFTGVVSHYGEFDPTSPTLRPLCIKGGDRFTPNTLSLFTKDPDRVTCPNCLEWMHA